MSTPLRVAIMYDQESWVLEYISNSIQKYASSEEELLIEPIKPVRARKDLLPLLQNYDVLHFMSPGDFYRLASSAPMPTVVTVHHVATRIRKRFNRLGHYADVICTINGEVEENLEKLDGIRGIPRRRTNFGIDTNFFRPQEDGRSRLLEITGLPAEAIILGVASKKDSNEDERKGFDRLWRVLEHLRSDCEKPVRLVLFGPGPEKPIGWSPTDIPESVRDMVILPGYVPAEDLAKCYAGLDFYVCLSRIEGGPYPVMEAMAAGTRVVSTPVGIVPELIRNGENGYLVNDSDYLERILTMVAQEPFGSEKANGIGAAARKTIQEKRSWSQLASTELYQNIYREAIERYRSRSILERLPRHVRLRWAQVAKQKK